MSLSFFILFLLVLEGIFISKKEIHFIGILSNVDESILNLKLDHGFEVREMDSQKLANFISQISLSNSIDFIDKFLMHNCIYCKAADNKVFNKVYFIANSFGDENFEKQKFNVNLDINYLIPKIRLVRLYSGGNVEIPLRYYYTEVGGVLKGRGGSEKGLSDLSSVCSLKGSEIMELHEFIQNTKFPFGKKFLNLALSSFESSYRGQNPYLQFLSLINALEILLKSGQTDLSYTLSRNGAVIVGNDKEDCQRIYDNLKCLYTIRSFIVHNGEAKDCKKEGKKRKNIPVHEMLEKIKLLRGYVGACIREMNFIVEKEGKNKQEILKMLNTCGFGQRPWRDES